MYDILESYCIENMDSLYRLAYSYVRNQEDALDIVSEAILKGLKNRSKLRKQEAVKPWMYKILVNTAMDYLKDKKKYVCLDSGAWQMDEGQSDDYRDLDLHAAIENLAEPYHTIILLRYFEDMKLQEIAEVMDENVNTVKSQLYAGLRKLKISLT